jgi:hypothetical protein
MTMPSTAGQQLPVSRSRVGQVLAAAQQQQDTPVAVAGPQGSKDFHSTRVNLLRLPVCCCPFADQMPTICTLPNRQDMLKLTAYAFPRSACASGCPAATPRAADAACWTAAARANIALHRHMHRVAACRGDVCSGLHAHKHRQRLLLPPSAPLPAMPETAWRSGCYVHNPRGVVATLWTWREVCPQAIHGPPHQICHGVACCWSTLTIEHGHLANCMCACRSRHGKRCEVLPL